MLGSNTARRESSQAHADFYNVWCLKCIRLFRQQFKSFQKVSFFPVPVKPSTQRCEHATMHFTIRRTPKELRLEKGHVPRSFVVSTRPRACIFASHQSTDALLNIWIESHMPWRLFAPPRQSTLGVPHRSQLFKKGFLIQVWSAMKVGRGKRMESFPFDGHPVTVTGRRC